MITQKLKGDDLELKMEAAGKPAFDICDIALDQFWEDGFNAAPFLLMLYDEGRMPFSSRVPRDSFVAFIKEALARFPHTGTFEAYIFILQAIFGDGSGVQFTVVGPGQIGMLVNATSSTQFNLTFGEVIDGALVENDLLDSDGNILTANGISGIDSEAQLAVLLSEIIPAGIAADITLAFFALYSFIDNIGNTVIDDLGNQIVFIET